MTMGGEGGGGPNLEHIYIYIAYIYIYINMSDTLKKWTPNLDISPHQGDIYASKDPLFNHQYLGPKPETASDFPGKNILVISGDLSLSKGIYGHDLRHLENNICFNLAE